MILDVGNVVSGIGRGSAMHDEGGQVIEGGRLTSVCTQV